MAEKIRIALLYKDLGLGGVQRKMVDIVNALDARDNIEVYIFLTNRQGEYLEKIPRRTSVIDLNVSLRPPQVFTLPVKLAKVLNKHKPQVVLAMMDTFGCSAVLARKMLASNKPAIFISQDIHATGFFRQRPLPNLRKALVRTLYPQADMVLSVSKSVTEDLVRNYRVPKQNITLIKNWTSVKKQNISISKKTIDVIYIGRFAPEKDLPLLLEGFSLLRKRRPSSTLSLVGYGEEEASLRKKIDKLKITNQVSLPGFTFDTNKFLKISRVFVMTSYNEGIPMAMLEAMAMGVPVISRTFPGISEIIQHKKTGFIANSADSISECMYYLLTNSQEAERVAQSALEYVKRNYSQKNLETFVTTLLTQS